MNSNRNQDESRKEEETVDVVSPYNNEIENFDNPESYPDLMFVIQGMTKPLQLHREILAETCGQIKEMLKDKTEQRLEWGFDTSKKADREALMKALRFCYGETQSVGTKNGECIAMIAAMTRLQVTGLNDAVKTLSCFSVTQSRNNVKIGVELLKTCAEYTDCCNMSQVMPNRELASTVLTNENICMHFKYVVDNCLMLLPPDYLALTEFGEPHTRYSEFSLRTRYVRSNVKHLSKEDKQAVMCGCDWSTLNSHELRELRMTGVLEKDELLEAYEKALEYREIECEQAKDQVGPVGEERLGRAEEELRELETRYQQIEKDKDEKDEKIVQLEKEKDEKGEKVMQLEKEKDEKDKKIMQLEKEKGEKDEKIMQLEKERDEAIEKAKQLQEEREKFKEQAESAERTVQKKRLQNDIIFVKPFFMIVL